jgi:hypothetical protein
MQPERVIRHHAGQTKVDRVAELLFALAGDQAVRVIEAVAAVLARPWPDGSRDIATTYGLSEDAAAYRRAGDPPAADATGRWEICQRIARRALRGSLVDPTRGATAMHRIDVSPAWSRDLLPIGMFGPFLFYRLASGASGTRWVGDWSPLSGAGEWEPIAIDR